MLISYQQVFLTVAQTFVCEQSSHANGLTYFKFRFLNRPQVPTSFMGMPVALDGMKTSCGAVLIASQQMTFVETASGGGGAAAAQAASVVGDAASMFSPSVAEKDNAQMKFNDRHQLVDDASGQPIANAPYRVTQGNDVIEDGETDDNGYANLLSSTINPESVTYQIGENDE